VNLPDRILFLDASSLQTHVGIFEEGRWLYHHRSDKEALNSVFQGTRNCLDHTGLKLLDLQGFVFCAGPGSTLGIRITTMAINGWKSFPSHQNIPVFKYYSLEAVACLLIEKGTSTPFTLVSDFRKDLWNHLDVDGDGNLSPIKVIGREEAERISHLLLHIRQRNQWLEPPGNATTIPYSLKDLPEVILKYQLLLRVSSAEAFAP
tara:strand:+ start:20188 stop:20802 length:615 start_codon:yes stop_codon:yes gene_type:complete